MNSTLLAAGIAFVGAAIVGGGLKAFGFELPLLKSVPRQLLLGTVGVVFFLVSIYSQPGPTRVLPQAQAAKTAARKEASLGGATASLVDTQTFLLKALSDRGELKYTITSHDNSAPTADYVKQATLEETNFRTVRACQFRYHSKLTYDGKLFADDDQAFDLSRLLSIERLSLVQSLNRNNAESGQLKSSVLRTNPPMEVVWMSFTDGDGQNFVFRNPEIAERVAEAFRRAANLCSTKPPT